MTKVSILFCRESLNTCWRCGRGGGGTWTSLWDRHVVLCKHFQSHPSTARSPVTQQSFSQLIAKPESETYSGGLGFLVFERSALPSFQPLCPPSSDGWSRRERRLRPLRANLMGRWRAWYPSQLRAMALRLSTSRLTVSAASSRRRMPCPHAVWFRHTGDIPGLRHARRRLPEIAPTEA